jgi:2-polyprenyl-3-methyl-5-hydroxy-6-metoxy-1,4-benzoquinol methylase
MGKIKSWGKEIWEDSIKNENEATIILGRGNLFGNEKTINLNTKIIMSILDKEVFPLVKSKGSVLDAGVGPMARFAIEFSKRGYKVVGVDISKTVLKYAKKHIRDANINNVKLQQTDLIEMNLKYKFNLIFCYGTFVHIPCHLGLFVLRNFNKCLRNNGYALIEFPVKNEKDILIELVRSIIYKLMKKFKKWNYIIRSFYTEDEIKDMISRTGFEIVKIIDHEHPLYLLKKIKGIKYL